MPTYVWIVELLIALAGLGAFLYYQQSEDFLQKYHISFIDASFDLAKTEAAAFANIYFNIKIDVANITDFTGTLQSALLNVYLKSTGTNLGYVNLPAPVTINPQAHTVVSIPIAVKTANVIDNVTNIYQIIANGQTLTFNIKGKLVFGIGTLTVDQDYPVKLN